MGTLNSRLSQVDLKKIYRVMKSKYHAKNERYCVINVKVVRSHVIGCHARRLRGRDYNGCNSGKVLS